MEKNKFEERLKEAKVAFHNVVPFDPSVKLLKMDFTQNNQELTDEMLCDTELFSEYVNGKLADARAEYGIGGYDEYRTIYSRSQIFGPSPTTGAYVGAKAPSRWEGEEESESMVEEETIGYRYPDPFIYKLLKDYAVEHRSNPTQAESVLWELVKTKQLNGYKFRRQHIVDRFITDFVCLKHKLVIEIDGLIHQLPENQISDLERTKRLNQIGFEVIRFTNDEVLFQTKNVLNKIIDKLNEVQKKRNISDLSYPTRGQGAEPRRLHLGIDIWGKADTPIYSPLIGTVHSFAFNDAYGDYGATLILQHQIDDQIFHTLYGHLSLKSIQDKKEGQTIEGGDWIASFGEPKENGHWPPHLHFQVILDMQGLKGDYPGVCKYSEREKYLANCPDPDFILGMMRYAIG